MLAVSSAAAISMLMSSIAFAASYRPDARIRLSARSFPPPSSCAPTQHYTNPWTGNNIYNTTGTNQTVQEKQYSGGDCFVTWQFQISVQNDGTKSDRFSVKATGPAVSASSWTVKYFHGTTNVTSLVVNGTYRTGALSAGSSEIITAKAEYLGGQNLSRLVTATSVGGGTKDTVKFAIVECYSSC